MWRKAPVVVVACTSTLPRDYPISKPSHSFRPRDLRLLAMNGHGGPSNGFGSIDTRQEHYANHTSPTTSNEGGPVMSSYEKYVLPVCGFTDLYDWDIVLVLYPKPSIYLPILSLFSSRGALFVHQLVRWGEGPDDNVFSWHKTHVYLESYLFEYWCTRKSFLPPIYLAESCWGLSVFSIAPISAFFPFSALTHSTDLAVLPAACIQRFNHTTRQLCTIFTTMGSRLA